jgi:hypothetical protein
VTEKTLPLLQLSDETLEGIVLAVLNAKTVTGLVVNLPLKWALSEELYSMLSERLVENAFSIRFGRKSNATKR